MSDTERALRLPLSVHYGEAVKIKDADGYTVASLSQIHLHGRRSKNEVSHIADYIVEACNGYLRAVDALSRIANGREVQTIAGWTEVVDVEDAAGIASAALASLPSGVGNPVRVQLTEKEKAG